MAHPWLEKHLEEFVKPHAHKIPKMDLEYITQGSDGVMGLGWSKKFVDALRAVWFQVKRKAGSLPIILPGRDTTLLWVMAELEGFPVTFRPEISSVVSQEMEKIGDLTYQNYYCVDTGYSGSVPKRLKCAKWDCIYWSYHTLPSENHQVFYGCTAGSPVRSIAYKMEGSPKYWTHGSWIAAHPVQRLESREPSVYSPGKGLSPFDKATILTMWIVEQVTKIPSVSTRTYHAVHIPSDEYYKVGVGQVNV